MAVRIQGLFHISQAVLAPKVPELVIQVEHSAILHHFLRQT